MPQTTIHQPLITKLEHSAGGVVFKKITIPPSLLAIRFLIGQHSGYHKWVLPKGLIEPGETPQEAALREVQEETGITAKIIGSKPVHTDKYTYTATFNQNQPSVTSQKSSIPLRRVKTYQEDLPGDTQVLKTVDFYLMEWVSGDPNDRDWEMSDAGWFTYEEALAKLAFPGEKLALKKAITKIGS